MATARARQLYLLSERWPGIIFSRMDLGGGDPALTTAANALLLLALRLHLDTSLHRHLHGNWKTFDILEFIHGVGLVAASPATTAMEVLYGDPPGVQHETRVGSDTDFCGADVGPPARDGVVRCTTGAASGVGPGGLHSATPQRLCRVHALGDACPVARASSFLATAELAEIACVSEHVAQQGARHEELRKPDHGSGLAREGLQSAFRGTDSFKARVGCWSVAPGGPEPYARPMQKPESFFRTGPESQSTQSFAADIGGLLLRRRVPLKWFYEVP